MGYNAERLPSWGTNGRLGTDLLGADPHASSLNSIVHPILLAGMSKQLIAILAFAGRKPSSAFGSQFRHGQSLVFLRFLRRQAVGPPTIDTFVDEDLRAGIPKRAS